MNPTITHSLYLNFKPMKNYMFFLLAMLGFALLTDFGNPQEMDLRNQVFPILILLTSLKTAWDVIKSRRLTLLTPMPWFLASCGFYYGLGPLVNIFGSAESQEVVNKFFPLNEQILWQTNLLNLVGILVIVVSFMMASCYVFKTSDRDWAQGENDRSIRFVVTAFLMIGMPIRYFYIMPYVLGYNRQYIPSNVFVTLSELVILGLLLLGYLSVKGSPGVKLAFISLLILELATNFLSFGKQSFLQVIVIAYMGLYLANRRMKTLLWMVVIILLMWFPVTSIFSKSRLSLQRGTWEERLTAVQQVVPAYFRKELGDVSYAQFWWTRLCLTSVQAFVLNQYDSGYPGKSLKNAQYSFIPRFIWKDKPSMTDVALEFNQFALGYNTSASGPGIFGEGYWNAGWLGVILMCSYIGIFFAFLSQMTLSVFYDRGWIFLPLVFIGMRLGFRLEGWFLPEYLATTVYFLFFYIAIYVTKKILEDIHGSMTREKKRLAGMKNHP